MDEQELQKEINKTKKYLANMEKLLDECKYKRWKPKDGKIYWYLTGSLDIWVSDTLSLSNYETYNCFQTEKQAKAEAEKILVRRMLEDIARKLNKGQKIDWSLTEQTKYYIAYDTVEKGLYCSYNHYNQIAGVVYCVDMNFCKVAIEKIGEQRLKKYLRGE